MTPVPRPTRHQLLGDLGDERRVLDENFAPQALESLSKRFRRRTALPGIPKGVNPLRSGPAFPGSYHRVALRLVRAFRRVTPSFLRLGSAVVWGSRSRFHIAGGSIENRVQGIRRRRQGSPPANSTILPGGDGHVLSKASLPWRGNYGLRMTNCCRKNESVPFAVRGFAGTPLLPPSPVFHHRVGTSGLARPRTNSRLVPTSCFYRGELCLMGRSYSVVKNQKFRVKMIGCQSDRPGAGQIPRLRNSRGSVHTNSRGRC